MEKQVISDKNILIVDWLTITNKCWSVDQVKVFLGLSDIQWDLAEYGRYGYHRMEVFNGISILSDGYTVTALGEVVDMGICIEISGQGCRALETYGKVVWLDFLSQVMEETNEFKVTRIDLAFDDHTGILPKAQLQVDTDYGSYRSKFRTWELRYGNKGFSVYHGSKQSPIMIRIYDKAMERGLFDGTHWIRVEIQIRARNAAGTINSYLESGNLGAVFGGILATYLVYCEDCNDSNKSRWPVASYWNELIQDASQVHIAETPGVEYNIFHLESFLVNTAGGALQTWIEIFGKDAIPKILDQRKGKKRNPKHERLLEEHKRMIEEYKRKKEEEQNGK